ncbi:uncharacterized protein LOC124664841 [Lolium rigidum]|uniref:uncharacterized protein LOC124664841 n=1 Tax=Lolium rigidum TaxID=89674 RepID=UPI001F5CE79C|nr:uncharacterized protein LOC124664841 [Lolium rigidum]
MEPAAATTSFPVAHDPPPRPAPHVEQLGQGPARRRWGHWAFLVILPLVLICSFALGVYLARHSFRDLGFVIAVYYFTALLYCCLVKLSHLRRDDTAAAPERWRVRLAVWTISVALANVIANRIADAMSDLGLQIAVWVITGVGVGVEFYLSIISIKFIPTKMQLMFASSKQMQPRHPI